MLVRRHLISAITCGLLTLVPLAPAQAQLGDLGKAASGALGGVLPNVGSLPVGNATGLLSYCVKNKLLRKVSGLTGGNSGAATSASPTSILSRLTKQDGMKDDAGYISGTQGVLETESGPVSMGGIGKQIKGKLCDLVLDRAGSFL